MAELGHGVLADVPEEGSIVPRSGGQAIGRQESHSFCEHAHMTQRVRWPEWTLSVFIQTLAAPTKRRR